MIKKIVAYIPCYLFYWLGDLVSKLINVLPDSWEYTLNVFYKLYSGLMLASIWFDDLGSLGVWSEIQDVD